MTFKFGHFDLTFHSECCEPSLVDIGNVEVDTDCIAVACDDILTSVDSDEPAQPSIKLRNSKCCSVSRLTVMEYSSD